ncbi:hypothetical protein [Salinicoccus halodurans]|uniref:Resolvase/invertase-type recombinase catalytic domain-containing protein n=1 Tax=Salinicoccus halodurans TaxID=407035 RepID=A0A0F7HLN1_9STAP|nr:hypothetical protein [Salinicoccus halodurans]AKG74522.1 hypothetical protein AAT16_10175 [Salinicoccus halodurans]SFK90310.1 hypothetical protein SAMN05216235_2425 [Salinicoccus halodurans]
MLNIAVYYKLDKHETDTKAVNRINLLINTLTSKKYNIKQVFIDEWSDNKQLNKLLEFQLEELDILYLKDHSNDYFNEELLNEVAKINDFSIVNFDSQI